MSEWYDGESLGFGGRRSGVELQARVLKFLTLGKSCQFSEPLLSHLQNGDKNISVIKGV